MPPKVDPKAAAAVAATSSGTFHVELTVTIQAPKSDDFVPLDSIHIRVVSNWLECLTTEPVLGGSPTWTIKSYVLDGVDRCADSSAPLGVVTAIDPGGILTAQWAKSFELDMKSRDRLELFNADPGLYAFIMSRVSTHGSAEDSSPRGKSSRSAKLPLRILPFSSSLLLATTENIVPVSVAYLDCSSFQLKGDSLSTRSQTTRGVSLSLKATQAESLLPRDEAVSLDPFVLDLHSLGDYPIQSGETQPKALDPVYLFGVIKVNDTISRKIFARPSMPPAAPHTDVLSTELGKSSSTDELDESADDLEASLTAVAAEARDVVLRDVPIDFRSCLVPGLGDRKLFKELLSNTTYSLEIHHEDLFNRVLSPKDLAAYNELVVAGAGVAPASSAKGAPPASSSSSTTLPQGPIHESDLFLIACMWRALESGGKVLPHGLVKFRLEQLLSSAEDLLVEFARTRGRDSGENTVVVQDDILGEVRLEKPSKPEKWCRPSDISLRSALSRALEEETRGSLLRRKGKEKPRHEKFLSNTTRVIITAELHRMLKHPVETPSVLSERVKKVVSNADGAFKLTTTLTGPAQTMSLSQTLRSTFNTLSEKDSAKPPRDLAKPETVSIMVRERIEVCPYTRMVFVFKYTDDETLSAINAAVSAVNLVALPDIQGSLRSYIFSKEEVLSVNSGVLDVVCGFTVIDDDVRIVVIEGLAGPDKAMQEIFLDIPRLQPNNKSLKILCNPEVLFPKRLYTEFGPEIKRIRIRDKISKLARSPEIYNRKQVDAVCFEAIGFHSFSI